MLKHSRFLVSALVVALALLLSSCFGPGTAQPPSNKQFNPWENLPVVGTDGSGTVDERGGVVRLGNQDIEFQIPRGALPPGKEVSIVIQEVDFEPQVLGVSALSGTTYAPKALQLSFDSTSNVDVLARFVLGNETEQARFVFNATSSNQSMIVESLLSDGSNAHVVPTIIDGQKITVNFTIPPLAPDESPTDMTMAQRAIEKSALSLACLGGFVDLNGEDVFPASKDTDAYLCRPPGENVIWDRVEQKTRTETYDFPSQAGDGSNGSGEAVKLITANVGNFYLPSIYNNKLVDAITAQRIYNNIKLLSPDIVLFQELYNGIKQVDLLLPDGYDHACPKYPSGDRYECIAWRTDKFTQTGSSKAITGESFPGEWALINADDSFSTDYCYKVGGKDTGGVWTMLESDTLGIPSFNIMSVHTATTGVKDTAYCREEQLLSFLQELNIARCTSCGGGGGGHSLSDSGSRVWSVVAPTRAILAGDFNIDPARLNSELHIHQSDKERFKWVVDWTKPLDSPKKPEHVAGSITPPDLNALLELRKDNNVTTSYRASNRSFDHVLVTGHSDSFVKPKSNLVDAEKSSCVVLDGGGGRHALSEDWWVSGNPDQSGMDHYALACNIKFAHYFDVGDLPLIAHWGFDNCSGADTSGNNYNLSGDFNGRCTDGVNGGRAATVISISPELSCLSIPPISELGTARHLAFDFWFRVRDIDSWQSNSWSSDGTAFFSFGEQNTVGKPFFGLFEYPLPSFTGIDGFMEFDDAAFGHEGSGGVHNLTDEFRIFNENYHHAFIEVDRDVGIATLFIDYIDIGSIEITNDFDLLGSEPGYLGAHTWWGGTNSCSSSSTGPRATIDIDEFTIRGR